MEAKKTFMDQVAHNLVGMSIFIRYTDNKTVRKGVAIIQDCYFYNREPKETFKHTMALCAFVDANPSSIPTTRERVGMRTAIDNIARAYKIHEQSDNTLVG